MPKDTDDSAGEIKVGAGAKFGSALGSINASVDYKKKLKDDNEIEFPKESDDELKSITYEGDFDGRRLHPSHDAKSPIRLIDSSASSERKAYLKYCDGVTSWISYSRWASKLMLEDYTPKRLNAEKQIRWYKNCFDFEVSRFIALQNADPSEQERLREEHDRNQSRFHAFQEKIGKDDILRDPYLPTDSTKMWTISILTFALVLETIVNGFALSEVMVGSLFEGAAIALALSIVNISAGLFFGFVLLRNIISRTRLWIPCIISSLLLLCLVLFVNFIVAHKREYLGIEFDALLNSSELDVPSMQELANKLIYSPFAFHDLAGLVLLLVGLLAFAVAAYEGYSRLSDPIPIYSEIYKSYLESKEAISEYAIENEKSLHLKSFDDFVAYFTLLRNEVSNKFDLQDELFSTMKLNYADFSDNANWVDHKLDSWRSYCQHLVQTYRASNVLGREKTREQMSGTFGRMKVYFSLHNRALNSSNIDSLASPPKYFTDEVELPGADLPEMPDEAEFLAAGEATVKANEVERANCERVINEFLKELRKMSRAEHVDLLELSDSMLTNRQA